MCKLEQKLRAELHLPSGLIERIAPEPGTGQPTALRSPTPGGRRRP
jgi:hypothetical protein